MKNRNTPQKDPRTGNLPGALACPGCGMPKNKWPGEGYSHEGQTFCCQGCAEGTGCTCVAVSKPGFGEQRSGALAPKGELSGERDSVGTEEAIDQSGVSTTFAKK